MTAAGEPGAVLAVLWVSAAPDGQGLVLKGGVWARTPTPGDYDWIADILMREVSRLAEEGGYYGR